MIEFIFEILPIVEIILNDKDASSRTQTVPYLFLVDGTGRDLIPDYIFEVDWGSTVRG